MSETKPLTVLDDITLTGVQLGDTVYACVRTRKTVKVCEFCDGAGDVEVVGVDGRRSTTNCPICDGDGEWTTFRWDTSPCKVIRVTVLIEASGTRVFPEVSLGYVTLYRTEKECTERCEELNKQFANKGVETNGI